MKKALLAVIGAGVVASMASLAFADDNAAYSANAVGVVKYTIPANGALTCVALPLDPVGDSGEGTWTWGETSLAEQLPANSVVYFWNAEQQGWDPYTKGGLWGWNNQAKNHEIQRGEAFFIQAASNPEDQVISLLGQLPVATNYVFNVPANALEVFTVTPYPVQEGFGETDLAASLPANSVIYFWDSESRAWDPYSKGSLWGWNAAAKAHTNFVGEGVFIKASQNTEVSVSRPFEWQE